MNKKMNKYKYIINIWINKWMNKNNITIQKKLNILIIIFKL